MALSPKGNKHNFNLVRSHNSKLHCSVVDLSRHPSLGKEANKLEVDFSAAKDLKVKLRWDLSNLNSNLARLKIPQDHFLAGLERNLNNSLHSNKLSEEVHLALLHQPRAEVSLVIHRLREVADCSDKSPRHLQQVAGCLEEAQAQDKREVVCSAASNRPNNLAVAFLRNLDNNPKTNLQLVAAYLVVNSSKLSLVVAVYLEVVLAYLAKDKNPNRPLSLEASPNLNSSLKQEEDYSEAASSRLNNHKWHPVLLKCRKINNNSSYQISSCSKIADNTKTLSILKKYRECSQSLKISSD